MQFSSKVTEDRFCAAIRQAREHRNRYGGVWVVVGYRAGGWWNWYPIRRDSRAYRLHRANAR